MADLFRRVTAATVLWTMAACATPHKSTAPTTSRSAVRSRGVEPESMVVIATERVTRQISMLYRLDLLKDNAHALTMVQAMRGNEPRVRTCYTSRLEAKPELAGDVALTFNLSAATGTVQQIAQVGGSIRDAQVVSCMKEQISRVRFNPPYDMQGKLIYQFQVLNNEASTTAKR